MHTSGRTVKLSRPWCLDIYMRPLDKTFAARLPDPVRRYLGYVGT